MCHAGDQLVSHGFAFPERNDDLFLVLEILLCHGVVDDSAVIHDVHVFDRVACEFRERRRRLRILSLFTHYELAFSQIKCLFTEVFLEHHRSEHRQRYLAFPFLVNLGLDNRSLEIDVWLCLHAYFAKRLDSCIHSTFFHYYPPIFTLPKPASFHCITNPCISSSDGAVSDCPVYSMPSLPYLCDPVL